MERVTDTGLRIISRDAKVADEITGVRVDSENRQNTLSLVLVHMCERKRELSYAFCLSLLLLLPSDNGSALELFGTKASACTHSAVVVQVPRPTSVTAAAAAAAAASPSRMISARLAHHYNTHRIRSCRNHAKKSIQRDLSFWSSGTADCSSTLLPAAHMTNSGRWRRHRQHVLKDVYLGLMMNGTDGLCVSVRWKRFQGGNFAFRLAPPEPARENVIRISSHFVTEDAVATTTTEAACRQWRRVEIERRMGQLNFQG